MPKDNVRALISQEDDRSAAQLLRDCMSIVSKHEADGQQLGGIVILIHEDRAIWPKIDTQCELDKLIVASSVLQELVSDAIRMFGGLEGAGVSINGESLEED